MKYLKISNSGKIDIEAFTLLGASTKRGDETKIGMFGSGNKYAIAFLLRNNYEVIAYSGLEKIVFSTQRKTFRDVDFDILLVNGKETSITIQLGLNWKLWQAIRELYSNAKDEGLIDFKIVESEENFNNDETAIFISCDNNIEDLMFDIDSYFLIDKKPIFECEYGAIYAKSGNTARIYRKGIKAFETNKNSLFDYDLYKLQINENRMAEYSWQPAEHIWDILYRCDKKEVIRKILSEIKTDYLIEREIGESIITPNDSYMSTQWLEVLDNRQVFTESFAGWLNDDEKIKTDFVPARLYNILVSKIGDQIKPKSMQFSENGLPFINVELSQFRAKLLSEVIDFIHDHKFKIDYKIKVVDFKDKKILGSIDKDNQIILIDVKVIDLGFDATLNTIIEEYIHLKYGVADETRGFQNSIITEFIVYMKQQIS